jgi:hypothetical protein
VVQPDREVSEQAGQPKLLPGQPGGAAPGRGGEDALGMERLPPKGIAPPADEVQSDVIAR